MAESSFPTLNCNDSRSRSDNVKSKSTTKSKANAVVNLIIFVNFILTHVKLSTYIGLPLVTLNGNRFGIPERVASAMEVNLSRCLLVSSY